MPLTTYTAGEVLTAASLNDNFTFAASSGALVCVKAETTVTAVTSTTSDGVFTSAFTNYLIVGRFGNDTAGNVDFKLRAGGASTSTNYNRQLLQGAGSTASASRSTGATSFTICSSDDIAVFNGFNLSLNSPQLATETFITMPVVQHFANYTTGLENTYLVGNQNSATQFDGIEFLKASGTFTMTFAIYGYSKTV